MHTCKYQCDLLGAAVAAEALLGLAVGAAPGVLIMIIIRTVRLLRVRVSEGLTQAHS